MQLSLQQTTLLFQEQILSLLIHISYFFLPLKYVFYTIVSICLADFHSFLNKPKNQCIPLPISYLHGWDETVATRTS
jgi:hypothetical protein